MFRTSLSGQIRQTKLPKWKPLLPIFEAVMNAVQSVQDRDGDGDGTIIVNFVEAPSLDIDSVGRIGNVVIIDEGVGFTDENMDSFNTAYSEHKYTRGGKGVGRFLWLKAFDRVEIDSVFDADGEGRLRRKFLFDTAFDPDQVVATPTDGAKVATSIVLIGFQDPYRSEIALDLEHIALRMCEHFILLLMQPTCPRIELRSGKQTLPLNPFFEETFSRNATRSTFTIRDQDFTVHGFRLASPRMARHRLIYCADERAVLSENLDDLVPNLSGRLFDPNGGSFVYLAVVTSRFLNEHVNQERTAFDIDDGSDAEAFQGTMLIPTLKRAEIRNACVNFVRNDLSEVLADINCTKMERIRSYVATDAPHYRVLLKRADEFIDRIPPGGTKNDLELALHRELHQREIELKREGSRMLVEAARLDDYEGYRDRLSHFLENNNELGVAALAQYVTHRKIILELFEKALNSVGDGRYPLERILHQIIFPMKSSTDETLYSQQNLWLLDERLNSYGVIHSDRQLRSIDGLQSDSALRPDLIAFDQEYILGDGPQPLTSLTVVEFKRPMRDDYTDEVNPLNQVLGVVEKVRCGTQLDANGRPISVAGPDIPATCYVVCDLTPKLKKILRERDATMLYQDSLIRTDGPTTSVRWT
ncbi:hypothetical protein [Sphingomonas sp. UYP23]